MKAVAVPAGVDPQSVGRRRREPKPPKENGKQPLGRPAGLTKAQLQQLKKELRGGAYAHGYSEDYWTPERMGPGLGTLCEVRSGQSGV